MKSGLAFFILFFSIVYFYHYSELKKESKTANVNAINSATLNNTKYEVENIQGRMSEIEDLANDDSLDVQKLLDRINSKSPYQNSIKTHGSLIAIKHRREISLKIYSMKLLTEKLDNSQFQSVFSKISQQANSPTVRRVAAEILKYKKQNRSFFREIIASAASGKMPK